MAWGIAQFDRNDWVMFVKNNKPVIGIVVSKRGRGTNANPDELITTAGIVSPKEVLEKRDHQAGEGPDD